MARSWLEGLTAPMVLDGAMHDAAFLAYVNRVQVADAVSRGHRGHGQSARSQAGGQEAIEQTGAELRFLPPYSPDFNPIELAFACPKGMRSIKLKAFLRKTAARTIPDLWAAVAKGIDTFQSDECLGYFAHAGYDLD